ncbi:MAG: hypothetical protein JSW71_16755 [Gemmatimonadota bacterium]|nr:MAG: hypothetical protein JSW71_16755 [Gemmatimonadota bacterium]
MGTVPHQQADLGIAGAGSVRRIDSDGKLRTGLARMPWRTAKTHRSDGEDEGRGTRKRGGVERKCY